MIRSAFAERPVSAPAVQDDGARKRRSPLRQLVAAGMATMIIALGGTASAASLPPETFADLAAKVTPAVVNISSTHHSQSSSDNTAMPDFPQGSPFEKFFHNFRGQGQKNSEDGTALGSGFIIDPTGYVVTNNHVVENSSDIVVTLNDGKDYPAKLIGTDKKTDLALLKIDAGKPLP